MCGDGQRAFTWPNWWQLKHRCGPVRRSYGRANAVSPSTSTNPLRSNFSASCRLPRYNTIEPWILLTSALLIHCSLCTWTSFSPATICAASGLVSAPSMFVNTPPLYTLSTRIGYHCSACSRVPRNRPCNQPSFARTTCVVGSSLKKTLNLLPSRGLRLIPSHLTSLVASCSCRASSIHRRIFPGFSAAKFWVRTSGPVKTDVCSPGRPRRRARTCSTSRTSPFTRGYGCPRETLLSYEHKLPLDLLAPFYRAC